MPSFFRLSRAESGRASQIDYSVIQEDYVKLFAQLLDPIFDRVVQTSNRQIYAHLQAVGVVNDHLVSCFRYGELTGKNT